ncbi:MaoC family dehydratase N-terminal domain-containing protein [Bacillus sp. RG28]|uniref:MaoC family dehydratase N-terminal domain-containing protein n=1 Tax=Gottfriedia endophytica TaxID=2820819 RepID=A0A940SIP5_9BACI|nr:MaoC/PaaZ C-terminal domain-containing protein [Gottfriedia endophytica]MBP0724039.1 MaoC family dehydratase N-terminal domain-containing protein [Gottfriedia endophytica]
MLTKKIKNGRKLEDLSVGEKLIITEHFEEKHIYLYLAMTGDTNPLYTQYNYASQTKYKKPIVPSMLVTNVISSAVTKHLPGPGSHIVNMEIQFSGHIHHNETVSIHFVIDSIDNENKLVTINVSVLNKAQNQIASGKLIVVPPTLEVSNSLLYDNF